MWRSIGLCLALQIQHPRWGLDQFDMIITPLHDYHTLSPAARQEVPKLVLPWLTPRQPPDKHVVCYFERDAVDYYSFGILCGGVQMKFVTKVVSRLDISVCSLWCLACAPCYTM